MRQFRLFFLFLLLSYGGFSQSKTSQTTDTVSVQAPEDASVVSSRLPSKKRLDDFRNNHDYDYERQAPPPENPLERFWNWIKRWISEFFKSSAYENFWQYVILAALAGLVIWLLYKAEFLGGLFGRKSEEDPLAYNRLTENIHELNFNSLIEDAVENHNYRLAVRLYYLKTLKQLTDKQLIHWQPTKTNRIYVTELENPQLKPDFERLTSQFEYVWYGEFGVSESEFGLLKEQFQFFLAKI